MNWKSCFSPRFFKSTLNCAGSERQPDGNSSRSTPCTSRVRLLVTPTATVEVEPLCVEMTCVPGSSITENAGTIASGRASVFPASSTNGVTTTDVIPFRVFASPRPAQRILHARSQRRRREGKRRILLVINVIHGFGLGIVAMPVRPRVLRVLGHPQPEIRVQVVSRLDHLRSRLPADRVPSQRHIQFDVIDQRRQLRSVVKRHRHQELLPRRNGSLRLRFFRQPRALFRGLFVRRLFVRDFGGHLRGQPHAQGQIQRRLRLLMFLRQHLTYVRNSRTLYATLLQSGRDAVEITQDRHQCGAVAVFGLRRFRRLPGNLSQLLFQLRNLAFFRS